MFASQILALLKCLPAHVEIFKVKWRHQSHRTIGQRNYDKFKEALSENYALTKCQIGNEYFNQIVDRNKKLKGEARFKRGKVAWGEHLAREENSPPRKLAKLH